jgi:hypothetical protein
VEALKAVMEGERVAYEVVCVTSTSGLFVRRQWLFQGLCSGVVFGLSSSIAEGGR